MTLKFFNFWGGGWRRERIGRCFSVPLCNCTALLFLTVFLWLRGLKKRQIERMLDDDDETLNDEENRKRPYGSIP